jgi:hypothetical protein
LTRPLMGDSGIHCYCLEKRGKDKYMTENQSLDGTASSSAAFFKCRGAARQFNRYGNTINREVQKCRTVDMYSQQS